MFIALLAVAGTLSTCRFHLTANHQWQGSCGRLFDETPVMTIHRSKAIATGTWRKDIPPVSVWAGDMTDDGNPNEPIEIEIYRGVSGVLRTMSGWVPVTRFRAGSRSVRFQIDPNAEVSPSELDRQIVRRAAAMLSSDAVWNRSDDRNCPANAIRRSIYCAMHDATIEVTGAFHHRRPAMQVVRQIVDERSAGRPYQHRLMDYNNDPATRLPDVQSLFAEALKRMGE